MKQLALLCAITMSGIGLIGYIALVWRGITFYSPVFLIAFRLLPFVAAAVFILSLVRLTSRIMTPYRAAILLGGALVAAYPVCVAVLFESM